MRAEVFGVFVLERIGEAIANADAVHAAIRSSGSNHNGFIPGITQPDGMIQWRLNQERREKAGIAKNSTRFCEARS